MKTQFFNRTEAGQFLAENLSSYANRDDVIVLGLPRGGGVPVAAEVAKKLNAPLDVFVVRKLGLPGAHGGDDSLLTELGELMAATKPDYTLLFRRLVEPTWENIRDVFYADVDRARWISWLAKYAARDRDTAGMNSLNPLYVPRNYVFQEVIAATEQGDRKAILDLLDVLRRPYDEQPGRERFAGKRPEWARHKPGCSMLSCSS